MPLDEEGRARVAAAVKAAEEGLTAEIVTCVVEESGPYPEAAWAGAAAGLALGCAAVLLRDLARPIWLPAAAVAWLPVAGLAGAAFARWCRPARRFLIGAERMEASAARRAKELFHDHGVADTTGRAGVLIYASLLERRVVVLADRSVRRKAAPEAWDRAVAAMTAAAHEGRVADGLCAAVAETAAALRAAGFEGPDEHGNELGDAPLGAR